VIRPTPQVISLTPSVNFFLLYLSNNQCVQGSVVKTSKHKFKKTEIGMDGVYSFNVCEIAVK